MLVVASTKAGVLEGVERHKIGGCLGVPRYPEVSQTWDSTTERLQKTVCHGWWLCKLCMFWPGHSAFCLVKSSQQLFENMHVHFIEGL